MNTPALTEAAQQTATTAKTPVRVLLKGMDDPGRRSLRFLFSQQKGRRYQVVNERPDIIIADIDDFRGKAAWNLIRFNKDGSRPPAIVLGQELVTVERGIALQKPFHPRDILAAMDDLLENHAEPVMAETEAKQHSDSGSIHASPSRMLHRLLDRLRA